MNIRTNRDRATEALQLTDKMKEMTGVDGLFSQVSDALCHLMHLCRLVRDEQGEDIDFEAALSLARINFEAEAEEDPDDAPQPVVSLAQLAAALDLGRQVQGFDQ